MGRGTAEGILGRGQVAQFVHRLVVFFTGVPHSNESGGDHHQKEDGSEDQIVHHGEGLLNEMLKHLLEP